MSDKMDTDMMRTAELFIVEISAIMHASIAVAPLANDAERLWIRARAIQQAASDVQALAGALEVLARRAKYG